MGVLVISFITDVLDGFIARKFNMISNVGKVLDPLADKVMQLAVLVCIALNHKKLLWLIGIMLIKDALMAIGALVLYFTKKKIIAANWFGKVSCFVSVFCSLVLIFTSSQGALEYVCAASIATVNIIAFISYAAAYVSVKKSVVK